MATNITPLHLASPADAVETAASNLVLLKPHPLALAFPAMTPNELRDLTEDIRANGQCQPIVTLDDMVLEGWHRYTACVSLGREPITIPLADGVNPVAYVQSLNLHRRHLDATQRAASALRCTEWENNHTRGDAAAAPPALGSPAPLTNAEMASIADCSVRTFQQAKAATAIGLGDALRDGLMTAERGAEIAAEVAKLPDPEKSAAVTAALAAALAAPKGVKPRKDSKDRCPTGDVPVVNLTPPAKGSEKEPKKEIFSEVAALNATIAEHVEEIHELAEANDRLEAERKAEAAALQAIITTEKGKNLALSQELAEAQEENTHLKEKNHALSQKLAEALEENTLLKAKIPPDCGNRAEQTVVIDPDLEEAREALAKGDETPVDVMDDIALEEAAVDQAAVEKPTQGGEHPKSLLYLSSPLASHVQKLLHAFPGHKKPDHLDPKRKQDDLFIEADDILEIERRLQSGEDVKGAEREAYYAYLDAHGLVAVAVGQVVIKDLKDDAHRHA